MDITVYLRDSRTARITGCTGQPTEVDAVVSSGFYRDIFTLDAVYADQYYPGDHNSGGGPTPQSFQVPAYAHGGIIPSGDVTIDRLSADIDSVVTITEFKVATSDDIAHEPLRQVRYTESFWAFPVAVNGETNVMMFRKSEVVGWGNVAPDD